MKNEIKIELTFTEAIELKSALSSRINQISRETTMSIEYRTNVIQILMQCYDKVNEQIENNLNK